MAAIEVRGLAKAFGDRWAVRGLDLRVEDGEIQALLGPNGAGKSTTVGLLTTSMPPTAGEARVAGYDVRREPGRVRARIGVVFQGPSLEPLLTARQNLAFHARLYKVPRASWEGRAAELLRLVELEGRADEPVHRFSGGMRRRLELVRAVLHRPRVLFVDEPTIGLDPQARLHLWDLLARLRREEGMAVLLTTHHMEEAERLADRVAIMDHGRLLVAGTAQALKASVGHDVVRLKLPGGPDALGALAAAARADGRPPPAVWRDGHVELKVASADRAVPALLEASWKAGVRIEGLEVRRPTLEDVFIARTGRALRDQP